MDENRWPSPDQYHLIRLLIRTKRADRHGDPEMGQSDPALVPRLPTQDTLAMLTNDHHTGAEHAVQQNLPGRRVADRARTQA